MSKSELSSTNMRETVVKLIGIMIDLDEWDSPKQKLPNCPDCGEDELGVIHPQLVMCYNCGWDLTIV